jgi:hypothetical protein
MLASQTYAAGHPDMIGHVRQQRQVSCPFNCCGKSALVLGASSAFTTGRNFASIRYIRP